MSRERAKNSHSHGWKWSLQECVVVIVVIGCCTYYTFNCLCHKLSFSSKCIMRKCTEKCRMANINGLQQSDQQFAIIVALVVMNENETTKRGRQHAEGIGREIMGMSREGRNIIVTFRAHQLSIATNNAIKLRSFRSVNTTNWTAQLCIKLMRDHISLTSKMAKTNICKCFLLHSASRVFIISFARFE